MSNMSNKKLKTTKIRCMICYEEFIDEDELEEGVCQECLDELESTDPL